jgi:hypothetical protein
MIKFDGETCIARKGEGQLQEELDVKTTHGCERERPHEEVTNGSAGQPLLACEPIWLNPLWVGLYLVKSIFF